MPEVRGHSVDVHRDAMSHAVLDATAALVAEHGVLGVTMSAIAARAGVGRATLYRYYSNVAEVLAAWHARTVSRHVDEVRSAAAGNGAPLARLARTLEVYAQAAGHPPMFAVALHAAPHLADARAAVADVLSSVLAEGVAVEAIRTDVPVRELAAFCVAALAPTGGERSTAAVRRAVRLTLAAISCSAADRSHAV